MQRRKPKLLRFAFTKMLLMIYSIEEGINTIFFYLKINNDVIKILQKLFKVVLNLNANIILQHILRCDGCISLVFFLTLFLPGDLGKYDFSKEKAALQMWQLER